MTNPSSRPPAGVPTSGGNAKYAIVAVLLLVATGAIFMWRRSSERDSTPAPIPSQASITPSAEPTNPKIEDIPPPPPVEEKPEAGPTGPRVIYVQQAAPCEAKCVGSATAELEQALRVRAQQARRCYNEALSRDPSLRGHLVFDVRISTAGNACAVNVQSNDMGSPKVASCAAHIFGAASYPAPRGGCVDSIVPLNFVTPGQ